MKSNWLVTNRLLGFMLSLKTLLFRTNIKKASQSALWLFLDKIFRYGISLFVGVWVARFLGPEQFGLFSYATAISGLFGILAQIGFRRIIVRELVKYPEKRDILLGSTFWMMLFCGLAFWIIAAITAYWINPKDWLTFYMVAIISFGFLFQPLDVILYFFESKQELKNVIIAGNIAFVVSSLLKVILVTFKAELLFFAVVSMLDTFFTAMGLFIIYKQNGYVFRNWYFGKKIAFGILKESYPLVFAGLMITINAKIDQIMLRNMVGEAEVGFYAVALRLVEVWFFIPQLLKVAIFPNLLITHINNEQLFYKRLEMIGSFLILFSYLIIIVYVVFADFIIYLLYGQEFAVSAKALRLLPALIIFVSLNNIKNSYLIIKNLTPYKLIFSLSAAIINVIANLILIPKYGMMGACYASLLSFAVSSYFLSFFFPKLHDLHVILTRSLLLLGLKDLWQEIKKRQAKE